MSTQPIMRDRNYLRRLSNTELLSLVGDMSSLSDLELVLSERLELEEDYIKDITRKLEDAEHETDTED